MSNDQTNQSFPKQARLLTRSDFDQVFAAKMSAADSHLVLYGLPNDLSRPRLGMVVSRKVGNAVCRNRWKRLLREAFRLTQAELPPLDLVCLPRGTVPELVDLQASLRHLARRVAKKAAKRTPAQPAKNQEQ